MTAGAAAWTHATLATMRGDGLELIEDGALVVRDGRIAWVGAAADLPAVAGDLVARNCRGALLTPGLIDCHTHLVFAGDRAAEFEQRLSGASYEDIARAGGGIMSTVRATRAAGEEALFQVSAARLAALMDEGVTTVEIKSGYGLNMADELKMLRVARKLGTRLPVTVTTSFLGAHALPPEFAGRADDYIAFLCEDVLPVAVAARLVDAVDAFCDNIGFTPAQTRRLFTRARELKLPVRLHAEQLSAQGGAALAASFGALSADHLEHLDDAGIAAMAGAGTTAVLLPAAFYFMRETKLPPIAALRAAGVPMAVATDLNPGTAPVVSLLAAMHMACTLFRLTPAEAWRGVTANAARALGLADRGTLEAGKRADFCVWPFGSPAEACYWLGHVKPAEVVVNGSARHG